MNFFIVAQIPAIPPLRLSEAAPWARDCTIERWTLRRADELFFSTYELADSSAKAAPLMWDGDRRESLRVELDAAFFHLFGVDRDAAAYILETFPIIKRKDEAKYGEYRTKRLILEVYDRMADAIRTGAPYQTILDPPPGDGPRHPAKQKGR